MFCIMSWDIVLFVVSVHVMRNLEWTCIFCITIWCVCMLFIWYVSIYHMLFWACKFVMFNHEKWNFLKCSLFVHVICQIESYILIIIFLVLVLVSLFIKRVFEYWIFKICSSCSSRLKNWYLMMIDHVMH